MAYNSAIFHIDLVNGSDAARTALTSCTASNPSGSITNIAKTAHGLVTGAVVDLTLFTAWLNSAWKITVVDANNFTLDEAVWQTTGDTSGTATPRGGMNWADAWLTVNAGATAARIQSGDEMRIAKTEDPTSLGQNATWTDGSQTVTLTTAVTKKIEDAISGWTAATNITAGTNASRKIGATAVTLTPDAAFTTGKVAYAAIAGGGTQDFSAFTHVSFWMRPLSATAISTTYRLVFCSDANGNAPVTTINLPDLVASTAWQIISISAGGNISASVQSIAIYAVADPGTVGISINNLFAHTGTLDLNSLIGPSSTDCYYTIQSIDGTTIKIDSNNTQVTGNGWSGSGGTTTLYYRTPIKSTLSSGSWQTVQEAGGTLAAKSHYSGGWNTGSNTRTGETVIASTVAGVSTGFTMSGQCKLSWFVFSRFASIALSSFNELDNVSSVGGQATFSSVGLYSLSVVDCRVYNNSNSSTLGFQVVFVGLKYFNNAGALNVQGGQLFISSEFRNNGNASMTPVNSLLNGTGSILLRNCILTDATEFNISSSNLDSYVWSFDHDNTPGNHWGFTYGATINWQTSVKQGSDPGSWMTAITKNIRASFYPIKFKIAEVACAASALVTVKVWVKKDHATNIEASIYVEDAVYNIDGVSASEVVKADDTNWEELTLTFTPSEAGIVPIYAKTYYVAGNSNSYIGSITVTQA